MSEQSSPSLSADQLLEDTPVGEWVPDYLNGFSRQTLPLEPDDQGPLNATLIRYDAEIRHAPPESQSSADASPAPVLYLHGWADYFFNTSLAQAWAEHGRPFYALDFRKYGRSLRPWQSPGYIEDLHDYDAEIDAALEVIQASHRHAHPPIIQAHSTGGLVAALWADRHPGRSSALVLNSPWLELPGDVAARTALEGVMAPLSQINPTRPLKVPAMSNYWQSLSSEAQGEWSLHPLWRPRDSFPVTSGWLRAVLAGHRQVFQGLSIDEPVLVLLSHRTVYGRHWTEQMLTSDSVLDVELLARRSVKLGPQVTVIRVQDAMHDIFASHHTVRARAFAEAHRWLEAYGPERSTAAP